jgi:hypothetical protein
MTLKEIKVWIELLPPEILEYSACASEYGDLTENTTYRLDMPFISINVDEDNKEVLFEVRKNKKSEV